MAVLNVKQLHNETSAVINEVAKGKSFEIERRGKVIATIRPADNSRANRWEEIMAPVWELQKKARGRTPNRSWLSGHGAGDDRERRHIGFDCLVLR